MDSVEQPPSRRADVIWRRMGDESVLLNVRSEDYFTLNEVGTRIWELIDGETPPTRIVRTIAEEYEAPADEIEADVASLLEELREQGLLG